jgi:outer membrane biosynthesis protein TonB
MSSPNVISFSLGSSMNAAIDFASRKSTFDLIMARVSYVLLDDSNKDKFTSLGGWKAIGTIECRPFVNFNNPESDPVIARPISSNITRYPLVNEIVVLKVYVSKEAQNNFNNYKPEVYYTDIISLFNAPEENAAPDESYLKLNPNEKYVTGKYVPSGEVKRLIKAPGDITIEGRRGNSIRFGSNMEGFKTPWVAKKNNPIFVISNNQAKTADASARFESINDDGSTLMMMSGHNVSFQPASTNFDSYNTTVTIPEKNNVVVTDQQPKVKPQESLKQEDSKPIPKETPEPTKIPVANPAPVSQQPPTKSDEEQLPEREDLLQINIDFEEVRVSLGSSGDISVNPAELNNKAKEENKQSGGKIPSNVPAKKQMSRASTMNSRVLENIKKYSGTGFIEKLTKICTKYSIDYKDMLVIMAFESGGDFQRGKLANSQTGKAQAVGIIQFTDAKKNSVFQGIRKQPQFSSLKVLEDIADVPVIKVKGQNSKYNFDQLDLVEYYLSTNNNQLKNPVGGKVDRYGLYGIIFYPRIVSKGRVSEPDNFVLGTEISPEYAFKVGSWNKGINDGYPITVKSFKDFTDSLFGNTIRK